MSRDNTKARESILEEDLAKNVSLSLLNSFCMNRESKVKGLSNQVKRLQEQKEWMRTYEQLKAWEEIVISSEDEEELARQITMSNVSGPSTSKTGARTEEGVQGLVFESSAGERKRGLSVNSDEI